MANVKRIVGRKPILDALNDRSNVDTVYISNHVRGEIEKELRKRCKERGIPFKRVHKDYFKKYGNQNHQFVEATISPIKMWSLSQLVPHIYEKGEAPFLLWLDHVNDVRNMGAIARSALAFGVHGLIIPSKNSAPINEVAIKTSAGALLEIPVIRFTNQGQLLSDLTDYGIKLLGASLEAKKVLGRMRLDEPSCLIIGSEEKGINRVLATACAHTFKIPHSVSIESLNAAVAAGICCYEAFNQRNKF